MKRVAQLANSDPSPLVRATARLRLIEWQYEPDSAGSVTSGTADEIRPANFSTRLHEPLDEPDFDIPRVGDDDSETIGHFAEPESPEWMNDQQTPPGKKERAFRLIKAESQTASQDERPDVLRSPFPPVVDDDEFTPRIADRARITQTLFDAPLGFTGPSSILPSESQQSEHFVPIEDRWRIGFPEWDRYGKGNPDVDDQPYETGHWWDPYNQNVLKGDFPIIGQHTFLNIVATNELLNEFREVPTGTTPFESTVDPNQQEFF
jgi:hypothetical protein